MKQMKRVIAAILIISSVVVMTGCSIFDSRINDIKGKLSGNSYSCYFYDNNGEKFLTVTGQKIGLTSNVVEEGQIDSSDGSYSTSYGLSSIVTLNVDGKQMESCGDTIIFEEKGLSPDAEFTLSDINSKSNGKISDNAIISNVINKYKNQFGKSQVVVIQSRWEFLFVLIVVKRFIGKLERICQRRLNLWLMAKHFIYIEQISRLSTEI